MEDCPICYEAVDKSTGHCTLACNHSFHISCLTRWSAGEASCPMCRHQLGDKEVAVKRQPIVRRTFEHLIIEDEERPDPPPSRKIRIGNGVEVTENEITIVMQQSEVSRGVAIQALRQNDGCIVNSIMSLHSRMITPPHEPTPVPPHDIMSGPSDDQTMRWALWRLFDDMRSGYQWNSYSDLRWRTKHFYFNEYWTHKDIHDICDEGMVNRGYESM